MTSPAQSKELILKRIPDVIVYDSGEPRSLEGLSGLINSEYKLVYEQNNFSIYKK